MNAQDPPELEVFLFGSPHFRRAGVEWAPRLATKAQALLYYLLTTQQPQSRAQLATLLWGDHRENLARANLRKALIALRKHFAAYLLLDGNTVALRTDVKLTVDVVRFLDLTAQTQADPAALMQAVALYRGDFLSGFAVRKAPDFELWQQATQSNLRAKVLHCLEQLLEEQAAQGKLTQAIAYAERILALEPWREETHRRLMELLAENGERSLALHQYERCRAILRADLDVEPALATQLLYERLVAQDDAVQAQPLPPFLTTPDYPLIGRATEWRTLVEAWRRAASHGPHLVVISGEPGIGKTRLAEELLVWVERQGNATAHTRTYAAGGQLAYAPIVEWLRSDALQPALAALEDVWLSDVARLLPELLIARPDLSPLPPLNERWQRQRLFEALTHLFLRATNGPPRPLLLVLDDLQWCDVDTLEWLRYLLHVAQDRRASHTAPIPLLIVGTARSDEVDASHPLHAALFDLRHSGQVGEIALGPLNVAESAELAAHVSNQTLDEGESTRLYAQTEGSPLFIVESARAKIGDLRLETGEQSFSLQSLGSPLGPSLPSLPPKVQAVIEYRLAQLSPPARRVVAVAATIGRSFTFGLLQAASELAEDEVVNSLDELWRRGIVRAQALQAYDFSHDRIREVAYGSISPVQRPVLHRRVARALEAVYADDLDPVSVQLAQHYERAGEPAQAVNYYQRAAIVTASRFDHASAIELINTGLGLQKMLPITKERGEQKFKMLLAKASSLAVFRGFAVPLIADVITQLEDLLPQIDNLILRFQACQRFLGYYVACGKTQKAHEHANNLLDLARLTKDSSLLCIAYHGSGVVHLQMGSLTIARDHFQRAAAFSNESVATALQIYWYVGASTTGRNLAVVLWLMGYPDLAHARATESVALTEQLGDLMQLVIALFFASLVERYIHAVDWAAAYAQRMLMLDSQHGGIQTSRISGPITQGWVWAQQGRLDEGIAQMRAGIDEFKATNHAMFQTHRLGWLAEAQLQAGQLVDAAATIDEGFAMAESSGQRSNDGELRRLHGELMVAQQREADAEASFLHAIQIARGQEAKSFELRAATSLARLWQDQGKRAEAHALLAEIYGWFTEGFDTADLRAAQTLLTELSAANPGQARTGLSGVETPV